MCSFPNSSFRHELEADIEPFRGLLLGLFFIGVGMSLDLALIGRSWALILAAVAGFMVVKAIGVYAVARVFRSAHADALRIALMLAQGGEFGFVLYATATSDGVFTPDITALLNAVVIVSMALTPLAPILLRRILPADRQSFEGIETADGLSAAALVIGFGRFGQVASQALLARGVEVSIIDSDTEMIRSAARFGFKIYYGDGTRLDVLRAAGAEGARIIAVCIDNRQAVDKAVEIIKAEFPLARVLARSFDRGHSLSLIGAGVDYEIRETLESAMKFGEAALIALGIPPDEAAETVDGVRKRDADRFKVQMAEGIYAGRDLIKTGPAPTPLSQPKHAAQPLSEETAVVAEEGAKAKAPVVG